MFIGSCLEEHVISLASLVSCDCICQDNLTGIPDMGLSRRIGNGCRHIILWFFTHLLSLPSFLSSRRPRFRVSDSDKKTVFLKYMNTSRRRNLTVLPLLLHPALTDRTSASVACTVPGNTLSL